MALGVSRKKAASAAEHRFDGVEVVDAPAVREHQSRDLVGATLALVGLVMVTALAIFAQATAAGVTNDIMAVAHPVASILQIAVSILMNFATLILPAVVIADSLVRRQFWLALQGAVAAVVAFVAAAGAIWLVDAVNYPPLQTGLSVAAAGQYQLTISPLVALMAGVLTAMGPRSRRPIMGVSWNLLWVALAAAVLTGGATLPAAFITVLLGRLVGLATRYVIGVTTDRATGDALVHGIRSAGLKPTRIVRVRDISDPENPTERLDVSAIRDGTYKPSEAAAQAEESSSDSISRALERQGGNRVYAVYDAAGDRWDAIVLDGDRQVLGFLQATWRTLRLRGVERRSVVSLRQAAERAALLGYAAQAAGVRTPKLVGIGEAADSMMLLQSHPRGLRAIEDMRASEISDQALEDVWRQLDCAHRSGLAHRDITNSSVLFGKGEDGQQEVWLIGWEDGDVASSELARSMDLAQMLAVLALKVGAERAVATARKVLPDTVLTPLAGLLQPVVFPSAMRELTRANREIIEATRQELAELAPSELTTVVFQPVRFGWRTVVIALMVLFAIWAVFTRFNFDQMLQAVQQADPWWMVASFVLSLTSYVGAAMALVGFLPSRISFRKAVLSQVAGSFTAITTPGNVGPIAISLRFLNRQGVRTSLSAATVALSQLALFVTTMLLVIGITIATGQTGALSYLPTTAIVVVLCVIAGSGLLLLIPPLRNWIWSKAGPTLRQVWPRVVWVLGRPKRLVFALVGTSLWFGGFVAAFWAALVSFGLDELPLSSLALVYLLGNTAGSAAPTPGGLGGVEIALTAGLRAVGVATATAASAAVLFRAITYWARVPLGWVAFRHLQKRGDL